MATTVCRESSNHVLTRRMGEPRASERLQQDHFDRIAERYEAHYGDRWSLAYRRRFINQPMFEGIDLEGLRVLDAMCGNGETAGYLLEQKARVTGLDISAQEIRHFESRWPDCEARCASILDSGFADASFDAVVIVGGLHHLHPHVEEAVTEIHRVLRPGGYLCFMEPHQGAIADRARRWWYQKDSMFAENEEAIDLESLKESFNDRFQFRREDYKGNIAYFTVLNSMILRIPLAIKPLYSWLAIALESAVEKLQTRSTSCFVVCQWRKRGRPGQASSTKT